VEPLADIDRILGPRDTVVVEGPDAWSYLQSQVSQDLLGIEVDAQLWTLVLDPTGKIESFARVTRTADERFELDTDTGFGQALLERIERFKIRVAAETSLVPAASAVTAAADAERVAAGWPRMGAEIVPGETIPAGTGLTGIAVSFTKGCYPGQELVERMDSRAAEAPRSLRRLAVADGAAVGDPVRDADGAEVGVLTSVAGSVAIGWVKRGAGIGEPIEFSVSRSA
jgi:folate-binding protein YgfZ